MLVDVAVFALFGVGDDATCHCACYLAAEDVGAFGGGDDYVGVLVLLARLRQPCLVEVAVVVGYGLHFAVNGEPVGVYVKETHEDAHHDATLVEVDILVDFLDYYYAAIGWSYYQARCVFFGEEAYGAAEEVDDDAVYGAHDCREAPERHLAVYETPKQQRDCCDNDEAINECAGRAIVREGAVLKPVLVNVDRDLCIIPNLAIHMNREANTGLNYNAQKDMIPLIGETESKGLFDSIIADAAQTDKESVISSDLFLYNRQAGTIWGADNEFISAPRLDDVMCAYSCMNALIDSDESNQESVAVCAVFDNEEVGSSTKQGADSTFLSDVLMRIAACAGKDNEDYIRACAGSFMLSADNAHAVHPNYQEKADPTNRPHMNKGIVIKYNANQKYTTDAVSAAIFKEICTRAGVPTQEFANRSDIPGGSTLGNIANCHVSMNTVDIGLAQLAMHSPYETAGIMDTEYMIKAVKEFFETAIVTNSNGTFTLE